MPANKCASSVLGTRTKVATRVHQVFWIVERFDYGVPEICLSIFESGDSIDGESVYSEFRSAMLFSFFQFRASLIEIRCTSHCRPTVYKCKPCQ